MFSRLLYLLARFGCWQMPTRWISHSRPTPGRTGRSGVAASRRAARQQRQRQKARRHA